MYGAMVKVGGLKNASITAYTEDSVRLRRGWAVIRTGWIAHVYHRTMNSAEKL